MSLHAVSLRISIASGWPCNLWKFLPCSMLVAFLPERLPDPTIVAWPQREGVSRPEQETALGKPELVLSRAAEMAICELVAEPQVRRAVREPFLRRALVSTGAAAFPSGYLLQGAE